MVGRAGGAESGRSRVPRIDRTGDRAIRSRRGRSHRRGADRRTSGGPGGIGIRLPRRIHRSLRCPPDHQGSRTGHGDETSGHRRTCLGRHPHAGGHPRLRGDDPDRLRRPSPQVRHAALSGVPPPSHHRGCPGLVGLDGQHHRRRTRRARRLPRTARLRDPDRRAVPAGSAAVGKSAGTRRHRRGDVA